MGIKVFVTLFMLTSVFLCFVYISTPAKRFTSLYKFNPIIMTSNKITLKSNNSSYPVTFAYLLSASKGDTIKLKRALLALYHPGNHYLIHMDREAPEKEQREIAEFVANEPVFRMVNNVYIVGKPNLVTYRGPTMLATTLHAIAMLLRCCKWDWFINLSASDYPLVTQDGMVSGLNFSFFSFLAYSIIVVVVVINIIIIIIA